MGKQVQKWFRVGSVADGSTCNLDEALLANADDPQVIEWLHEAEPGDEFPDGAGVVCLGQNPQRAGALA